MNNTIASFDEIRDELPEIHQDLFTQTSNSLPTSIAATPAAPSLPRLSGDHHDPRAGQQPAEALHAICWGLSHNSAGPRRRRRPGRGRHPGEGDFSQLGRRLRPPIVDGGVVGRIAPAGAGFIANDAHLSPPRPADGRLPRSTPKARPPSAKWAVECTGARAGSQSLKAALIKHECRVTKTDGTPPLTKIPLK